MSVKFTLRLPLLLTVGWCLSGNTAMGKLLAEQPAIAKPSQPFDPAGIHVVEFTDDSVLHGTVKSITDEAVQLQRSDASELMSFPLTSINRMVFDSEADSEGPVPRSTVQLVTGDWFVADVLLMREGKAELRLANQQRLSLDQKWIETICFAKGAAPDIFHGPESMEGWNSNGSWTCQDGVLRCNQLGNIGRTFPVVPDRIDLQFEMEKSEVQKNFMMSFNFSRQNNGTNNYGPNAWTQVRFNEGQLYIYAANGNKNRNYSDSLPRIATKPNDDGTFRYRILFDRVNGRMALFINGKKVADRTDIPPMDAGTWNGTMTFQPMRWGSDSEWALSNIHMIPWDGQLPQGEGGTTPARLDSLTLEDGTVKQGRLEAVQGGMVKFRSAAGSEEIDRNTISMLRIHRQDPQEVIPVAKGPRLTLADRGEIKLNSISLNEQSYTVSTGFAGEMTLPMGTVYALNYPNPELKDLPVTDRLVFRNGDQLRGTLEGAGHDAPVQWQFKDGPKIDFQTKRIGGVLLTTRPNAPSLDGDCVVRFRNGDWLGGKFLELAKDNMRLQSGFGNEFTIPRARVQTLYLSKPGKAAIWEGATQPETWWKGSQNANSNFWVEDYGGEMRQNGPRNKVYLDGAFLIPAQGGKNAGIGKQLDGLPERVEISFEVAGANSSPAFNLQLFYEAQGNNGLMMQVWQGGLYVYDMTPRSKKNQNFMGGQPQQVQWGDKIDSSARRHRFRIFADRRAHRAVVFIDDVQLTSVSRKVAAKDKDKENEDEVVWGSGLAFHTNGGGATIFNKLWVTPWNGQLPVAGKAAPSQESVALANGDEARAAIKTGSTTGFTLDFDGEELEIPREKILMADFGPNAPEDGPKLSLTYTVVQPRLRLAQGGALTVETMSISNGEVTCGSPSFGELKVPLGSFSEIIWSGLDRDIQNLQSKPKSPNRKAPKKP